MLIIPHLAGMGIIVEAFTSDPCQPIYLRKLQILLLLLAKILLQIPMVFTKMKIPRSEKRGQCHG